MSVKRVFKTAEELLAATPLTREADERAADLARLSTRTGRTQYERADEYGELAYTATDVPNIGTDGNMVFRPGTHFGDTSEAALQRIYKRVESGDITGEPTTYAVRLDIKNPYEITDLGTNRTVEDVTSQMIADDIIDYETFMDVNDAVRIDIDTGKRDESAAWEIIADALEMEGFDGVTYTNIAEDAGSKGLIPFRPQQVRMEFARFDPDQWDSPNPMASVIAGSTALGVMASASEKAQAGEEMTAEEFVAYHQNQINTQLAEELPANGGELGLLDTVRGGIQQYIRGASFGSADEMVAGIRASIDGIIDDLAGVGVEDMQRMGFDFEEQSFSDTYQMMLNDERRNRNAFVDANPVSATLLEIAGGIATGGATAKAATTLLPAARAGLVGAGTGFIDGAIYGFLDADTDAAGRFKDALKYGAMGAAFGGTVGKGVEKWQDHVSGKAANLTERFKDNLTIAVHRGLTGDEAYEAARIRTRVSPEELQQALDVNGQTMPTLPSKAGADQAAPGIIAAQRELQHSPEGWLKRNVGKKLYNVARKASDRLARVSPEIANDVRRMEMNLHTRTQKWMEGVKGWEKHFRSLSAGKQQIIARSLFNGDVSGAMSLLDDSGKATLRRARGVLAEANRELKKVGYDLPTDVTYYPRQVKDYDGLVAQLGRERQSELQQFVAQQLKKKNMSKDRAIAEWFRRNDFANDGRLPNSKARTIDTVSTEMMPFYGDAVESLSSYIHRASSDIEMKRFFNKSAAGGSLRRMLRDRYAGDIAADFDPLDKAIDSLVVRRGILGDPKAERAVKEVLKARFTQGRKSMDGGVKLIKDFGTGSALGQFASTITQFGDLANAIYFNGLRNTVRAMGSSLAGKNLIKLKDIGVDNRLTQDLQTAEGLTKWVDNVLTATGFKHMDRFGKATIVQGAVNKARKQLASPKGEAAFREKWGRTFGDDINGLISDLRANVPSENVKLLAFNTLSDAQPISLSEMPVSYLNSPNGRLFYTLKSYAVNQLNILNNTVRDPRVSGKTRTAAFKDLSNFLLLTGLVNGTVMEARNMIRGDEFKVEDIPDNVVDTLFGLSMVYSSYAGDKFYSRGDIGGGLLNAFAPPIPDSSVGAIPVVGKVVDDWLLGGKEKRRARRAKENNEFHFDTSGFGGADFGFDG